MLISPDSESNSLETENLTSVFYTQALITKSSSLFIGNTGRRVCPERIEETTRLQYDHISFSCTLWYLWILQNWQNLNRIEALSFLTTRRGRYGCLFFLGTRPHNGGQKFILIDLTKFWQKIILQNLARNLSCKILGNKQTKLKGCNRNNIA